MKRLLLSAFVLLGACASAPETVKAAGHPEEAAILAVVDAALLAAGNHDGAAAAKVFVADGWMFLQRRTAAQEGSVAKRPVQSFLNPPAGADPFIERYWEPVVQVRGGIAQVWAPYELRDNGAVVHCGIDAFQLVKMDGAWKVASLMFTMEPEACGEIGLPEVGRMRPRDGWREAPLQ